MASFKFVLRPSTKMGRHEGTLSLRVIHDRKPKTVSISCHLYPEEWDESGQEILYPVCDPYRREYLSAAQEQVISCSGRVSEIIQRLEDKGTYTVKDVITRFRLDSDEGKLLGFALMLGRELVESGQYRTAKAYATVSRGLVAFNKGEDIPVTFINTSLVKRFEAYLKENGKQPNTISYYMRNLRAIYNKAVDAKRIPETRERPFANAFTGVEETKKRALTADEVNKLKNIDFDSLFRQYQSCARKFKHAQNLFYSWRLFFFCLYAHGMCFVDLAHLKKSHVKDGVIRYYRKKTGKQIEVPINEGMRMIMESFASQVKGSGYLFPIVRNGNVDGRDLYETAMRTQNRRLKKLVELAGLGKGISTHVARHSWATICKNELLPLSVISEGLGHSSEKMTRKYLDSFDHSILGNAGKTVLMAISRPSTYVIDPL